MAESISNGHEATAATAAADDDDYMGDLSKFLPPSPTPSSKPQKVKVNPEASSNYSQPQWMDKKTKKERKQMEEDQKTLSNLQSAIPQSNIGFRLLKQMGYTPGSALGKEGKGRVEPVGVEIRRGRSGIGREDPVKEKARKERERDERKRRREEELMEDFGERQKSRWRGWRVVVNYGKAKAALDQLENKADVVVVEEEIDEDEERDSEEEEEVITEEDLQEILMKLRDEHRYCLFCGCQYESSEALLSNCPGINEDDH